MTTSADRRGSLSSRFSASTLIVVIEDESDIADFLRAYFRASGYDFVHVDPTSIDDVLAALAEHQPDCVLLDYGLRGFSGNDAHRAVRADARFDAVPIIVVTADITSKRRAAQVEGSIDAFVAKPFNVNTLAGIVEERIAAGRAVAGSAPLADPGPQLSPGELTARLEGEVAVARENGPVAFALVQVRCRAASGAAADPAGTARAARELIELARRRLPPEAVVAHTADDELAVLVPGMSSDDVGPILERALAGARRAVEEPDGTAVRVGVAAGLACYPDQARSSDELYMAADAALADALEAGEALRVAI